MSKSHLLFASEPLTFAGQNMEALCGITLAHAEPVMFVDLSRLPMPDFCCEEEGAGLGRDCSRCVRLAEHSPLLLDDYGAPRMAGKRVYLYAVIEGELARQYRGDLMEGLIEKVRKAEAGK